MKKQQYQVSLEIPVDYSAQVVVAGGGTAGAVAAISAAREDKSVLLLEQFGCLGGSASLALVTPLMHTHVQGNPMCSVISDEINRRSLERGFAAQIGENPGYFDPCGLKFLLEEMALEAGVRILYYSTLTGVSVQNGRIAAAFFKNKSGFHAVEGEIFIDCTGDGDLSVMAGATFHKGNPRTEKNQPMSLRYILGGVDHNAAQEFLPDSITCRDGWYIYGACTRLDGKSSLEKLFAWGMENGHLTKEDLSYWQIFGLPGRPDCVAFNCPEFFDDVDGTDPEHLTKAQIIGKKAILRQLSFYRNYIKGFENAYIAEVAPMVGIRESREIQTQQILTASDILSHKKHPDGIAQSNYPIDIHGMGDEYTCAPLTKNRPEEKPFYEVPYGALVVQGLDNLLVAGRCIGCDFSAQAAVRIMPTCRATGEAAGIAAALSIDRSVSPSKLDGQIVREKMLQRGAVFAEK